MVDFEYESLLERARERIPKNISERSRWTMPEPEILIEGNQTILRNFAAIVDAMDRDANHVYQFLINEYGLKEGNELGQKLKNLEMKWIENNFNLSKKDMEKVLSN